MSPPPPTPDPRPAPGPPPGRGDPDEAALVAACAAGDAAAWGRFDSRYRRLLVGVARDVGRRAGVADPASFAEDVAADVLAALLADDRRLLARFEGRSAVATWLAVIARRTAGRAAERARRAPRAVAEPADVAGAGDATPQRAAEREEARARVEEHLRSLLPRDRLALQLFYEGGRSYREVADALGVPAERVGTLLARARARLAKLFGL